MNTLTQEARNNVSSLLREAYACRVNNLNKSTTLAEEALAISTQINDKSLIARSKNELALFAMIRGEYEQSVNLSKESMKYFEELQDERGIADAKYNIAGVYYKTDNYHLGLTYLIDCLVTYRKYDDYHNQARVEKSLGTIYEYFGDQKKAVESYENSIEAARKAGDANLESNAYNPLSGIYLKQGKIEKAIEIIERSISIKKQSGDIRGLAFSIYGRGKIHTRTGLYNLAENDFTDAINIHMQMGERLGLGMAYYKISELYVAMDRLDDAKRSLDTALTLSREFNIVFIIFKCSYLLYQIYKLEGDTLKALEYLELYLQRKEAVINTQTLKVIENYELITKMDWLEKEAQMQREKAEIIEKKNRAEKAAYTKQEFLSTMSHEIRTPLNAVITIAALLEDEPNIQDRQLVDSLKFSADHLLHIINDILDFTKLDAGKAKISARPCHFYELLQNITNAYIKLAHQKGLEVELIIDDTINSFYEVDETKISQILGNLISNAIKFTEDGRIEVIVEKIRGDHDHDLINFKVTDTGAGIEEKHFEDIFDSFSQPESIKTRKQGGSGLGLAIVKKLVMLHGGKIGIESVVDKGSAFYFAINLKKSAAPVKTNVAYTTLLKNKQVLLAEDNMINALLISKILANWEIQSCHVKNGVEAVEKAKTEVFDFILMDIHMPLMDGFEATKHIRTAKAHPNTKIPIFAITADITAEHKEEYSQYFNAFLSKPIEIDKLYAALTGSFQNP